MANIIIGSGNLTGGALAPGASLKYNADGSIEGHARYSLTQGGTMGTILGLTHPDDSRATGFEYELSYDETFQYVDITFRGVWSGTAVKIDIQASLQANPIESHPNFVSTLGGTAAAPLNDAVFDNNGIFLGWPADAPSNLGGVRFYLAASATYRFTFTTASAVAVVNSLASIGGVASTIAAGNLIVSQTDGFMLQNVTLDYQYVGTSDNVFVYTVVYVSTQPPGWNTAIYPP